MKLLTKSLAMLLALLLVCGCASKPASMPEPEPQAEAPIEEPASLPEPEPETREESPIEEPAPEPEDWEEEWPQEYPVSDYRLAEGAIAQTGALNRYRYAQLDGAERYKDIVALYLFSVLGDDLGMEEDSPHDGYANWFIRGEDGSAAVSGSSITGRFCYSLSPGFDRILRMCETERTDRAAMERAARDFAALFSGITGETELVNAEEQTEYYHDERAEGMRDVAVPVLVCTFRSKENSALSLEMQAGYDAGVECGDSTVADPRVHCFTATVWPDGTVVSANNYITRAGVTENGTARMLTEDDLPTLISFLTSTQEHDAVVIESVRADRFSVYFGRADVDPAVTVEYHFESAPDEHLSTEFVLPGLFDPA